MGIGARLRRRASRLACLGGDRKAPALLQQPSADDAEAQQLEALASLPTRTVLGNRARLAVIAYLTALHIIVLRCSFT